MSNPTSGNELFKEYMERMDAYSDAELVEAFNGQVGNPGWGSARASYGAAIRAQLNQRNIDYSAIGDDRRLSYRNKVVLRGKKLVLAEASTS
ncbi:hypothetical protein [Marixanthomonas spongiae]|uniref:Uncharacterized protein n=1 Tax=Marixanthomonas spongiae TaxID=2174845 RepID=A0A2U0I581_9FLAO|nr:hypothetical protein [Marixanthomonas spongiae]PVW16267.1 hypothetical protein DDV96_03080 [Marixanthomonas spongiae]